MLRRENILITEDYMSKTTSATHFTAPGEIKCFDSSIHFGKESDRVEIQNCNIKTNVLVHCSKNDTYDFETGALIALMKMCGVEKVKKAAKETFFDVAENSVNEYEEEIKKLEKENEQLQHEYDLCLNSENALKITTQMQNKSIEKLTKAIDGYKNDLYKVAKRCRELEAKEAILNKQEETINKRAEEISVYFGGRGCGKQYKALVELFKKLDQKKVDAAYKEAYNTTLPLWQKEVLNQMYGVYKKSKEKIELPGTLDINGTVYRKSIQIKDFSNDQLDSLIEGSRAFTRKFDSEWLKPPTKREEMWDKIFALHKESDVIIKVKKEDINTFLHELENKIPEITWYSCVKIFETKYTIGDIYEKLKTCNAIYFRLHIRNKLSYTSDSHIYPYRELTCIDYLPPMRWDLFKKGRIVVGVRKEQYDEFILNATEHIDSFNMHKPYDFNYTFFMYNKDSNFINAIGRSQFRAIKEMNNHKVYYWEDVR